MYMASAVASSSVHTVEVSANTSLPRFGWISACELNNATSLGIEALPAALSLDRGVLLVTLYLLAWPHAAALIMAPYS